MDSFTTNIIATLGSQDGLDEPIPRSKDTNLFCPEFFLKGSCKMGDKCPNRSTHVPATELPSKYHLAAFQLHGADLRRRNSRPAPQAPQPSSTQGSDRTVANILEGLTDVVKSMKSSKEEKSKRKWAKNSKLCLLILSSKDGKLPPLAEDGSLPEFPAELKEFYDLPAGRQHAQIVSSDKDRDCHPDPSICSRLRDGNFNMDYEPDAHGKVIGLSPLLTGTSNQRSPTTAIVVQKLEQGIAWDKLSTDDHRFLIERKSLAVTSVRELVQMLKNFGVVIKMYFGSDSFLVTTFENFMDGIKQHDSRIHKLYETHGYTFLWSLLVSVHKEFAHTVNRAFTERDANADDFGRRMRDLISDIERSNFMNIHTCIHPDPTVNKMPLGGNSVTTLVATQAPPPPSSASNPPQKKGTKKRKFSDGNKTRVTNTYEATKSRIAFRNLHLAARALKSDQGVCMPSLDGTEGCAKFHLQGSCFDNCPRKSTHVTPTGSFLAGIKTFKNKVEAKAEEQAGR